jgi:hypothetical protein
MTDNHRSIIEEITHGTYQCREAGELARAQSEKTKTAPSCALSSFSRPAPGAQLKRITCHKGCSVTFVIKAWAASAERRVTAQLSGKALKRYYGEE